MTLTISKVRQNLFSLAEAAARGEKVEFSYQGTKFRLVAEKKVSKLSRLSPLDLLAPGVSLDSLQADMKADKAKLVALWEAKQVWATVSARIPGHSRDHSSVAWGRQEAERSCEESD